MKPKMTIREIRKILFDADKSAIINGDEMSNKESRDFLYAQDNQDDLMNVVDFGDKLFIYNK